MNIIDILIIGIILAGALQGYRRGLLYSIAGLIGNIAGFLLASYKYMAVSNWLNQYLQLQQRLGSPIYNLIRPSIESRAGLMQQQALTSLFETLPPELRYFISGTGVQGLKIIPKGTIDQITQRLAGTLAENILHLIAFALVYFVVVAVIKAAVIILLKPLGIFGGVVNREGGFIFGGLSAFVGLVVIAGLVSPLVKSGLQGTVTSLIEHSYFYPYLLKSFQVLAQAFSNRIGQWLIDSKSQNGILF